MRFSHERLSLSPSEFTILRDLIRERTGLSYDGSKTDLLADKLSHRAIERGFDAFIDYYYLLKYGPGAEEEWPHVFDALSVQETYFWREIDQIKALVDVIVPQYFAASPTTPLRIWSAACATGEEPLTIAMALNEAGWFGRHPIEILASDGSTSALTKARRGVYRERAFRNLPAALREKYFTESEGVWQVDRALHGRVKWSKANLMAGDEVARHLPAHIIFCRNVFIYFSADSMARTVKLFAGGMSRSAYLFVGLSESLLKLATDFELQEIGGVFVYVKRSDC
jgi:chemotaxis protein methyltransferase CheR